MRSWQSGMRHFGNNGMINYKGANLHGSDLKKDRD